jgi:hypothetical protein
MAAAPQHVRAAPLARALRARATATATASASAAPPRSQSQGGTSRRALLGLSEPELRQLALDLGQVLCFSTTALPLSASAAGPVTTTVVFHSRSKATGGSSCTTSSTSPGPAKSRTSTTVGQGLRDSRCTPPVRSFASLQLKQPHCFSFFFPVPKAFREALLGAGWTVGRSPVHHAVTASDGTTKVRQLLSQSPTLPTLALGVPTITLLGLRPCRYFSSWRITA